MKHISIMTLPFCIRDGRESKGPKEAFDFIVSDGSVRLGEKAVEELKKVLNSYKSKKNRSVLDKKHHPFVRNYICEASQSDSTSFLKVHMVAKEHFNRNWSDWDLQVEGLVWNANNRNQSLWIDDKWRVEIHKEISIILNEYAGLGYLTIGFEVEADFPANLYLEEFSKVEFFRYYTNSRIKDSPKYKLTLKQYAVNGNSPLSGCFSVQEFICACFSEIIPYVKFLHFKPIMLHLFQDDFPSDMDPTRFVYKIVRIPPSSPILADHSLPDIIYSSNGARIFVMNEGACVIEPLDVGTSSGHGRENAEDVRNFTEVIKKYMPSFILSLNQREILIDVNREISYLSHRELVTPSEDTVKKLRELKMRINSFQLRQVFFSISFYDEIDAFFRKLQAVFNIKPLLDDNMGSINEISVLLDRKEKEEASKRRDAEDMKSKASDMRLVLFGLLLSLLQAVTAFVEDDIRYTYKYLFVILVIFFSIYIMWPFLNSYLRQKKRSGTT